MRLTRCYCPEALRTGAIVTLPASAGSHLTRVLRLRAGAELTLFDGRGGEYGAELLDSVREVGRKGVHARIGGRRDVERETPVHVVLLQCLARAERMDWIVQKATELGVAQIVPVASAHGVVQTDADAAARRRAHWQAVAISACEQCGRNRLPEVHALQGLEHACRDAATPATRAADQGAEHSPGGAQHCLRLLLSPDAPLSLPAILREALGALPGAPITAAAPERVAAPPSVCLLIGPEGGLAEHELDTARRYGFRACRLGPRILRAETAPLAALASIQAVIGDFI